MVVKITYVNGEVEEFDGDSWIDKGGTFIIVSNNKKAVYIPAVQIRRIE